MFRFVCSITYFMTILREAMANRTSRLLNSQAMNLDVVDVSLTHFILEKKEEINREPYRSSTSYLQIGH